MNSSEMKSTATAAGNVLNSNASLAHIMDWIKTSTTAEQFNEIFSRVLSSTLKWVKTQRTFQNLPLDDQISLLQENLNDLFVLQMAETKSTFVDCKLNSFFTFIVIT